MIMRLDGVHGSGIAGRYPHTSNHRVRLTSEPGPNLTSMRHRHDSRPGAAARRPCGRGASRFQHFDLSRLDHKIRWGNSVFR